MQLQHEQELNLEFMAENLFELGDYKHLVLKGKRFEGCDTFETLTYFENLSKFVTTLGPIYNVESISGSCVSFSLGVPNTYILTEFQQLCQDSTIIKVHGYDKNLWDVLDVVYTSERIWRLKDIPFFCRSPEREAREPYVLER